MRMMMGWGSGRRGGRERGKPMSRGPCLVIYMTIYDDDHRIYDDIWSSSSYIWQYMMMIIVYMTLYYDDDADDVLKVPKYWMVSEKIKRFRMILTGDSGGGEGDDDDKGWNCVMCAFSPTQTRISTMSIQNAVGFKSIANIKCMTRMIFNTTSFDHWCLSNTWQHLHLIKHSSEIPQIHAHAQQRTKKSNPKVQNNHNLKWAIFIIYSEARKRQDCGGPGGSLTKDFFLTQFANSLANSHFHFSIVRCSITHPTRRYPSHLPTYTTTVLHPSEIFH